MTLKFLGISGSLRKDSRNTELLREAAKSLPSAVEFELADLSDIPFYNSDITVRPAAVERVLAQIAKADALVLACPEYNYSIAPALKNILDWASREADNALLNDKPAALMGAGGGMGTSRAQYHLRQVMVYLNMHPLNKHEVFVNAFAGTFDEAGHLVSDATKTHIKDQMAALAKWTNRLKAN